MHRFNPASYSGEPKTRSTSPKTEITLGKNAMGVFQTVFPVSPDKA
jgi:hypothetical protein